MATGSLGENCMSIRTSKPMAIFICFTLVATIGFSYTLYMWIGVAGALRKLDTEIQRISVNTNDELLTFKTAILINNPSEFTVWISYMAIKRIQVNQHSVTLSMEEDPGSFHFYDPPSEVASFSNVTIQFSFPILVDSLVLNEENEWHLTIRIHILTIFTWESVVRLDIERTYIQSNLAYGG